MAEFDDRMPFKGRVPDEVHHLGITPTARSDTPPETGDPQLRKGLAGLPGEYRLVFQSMEVLGLPAVLTVGRVRIVQTDGPVWTQKTHIVQRPGWRPVYKKWMEHFPVGDGYRLTVCLLAVELTDNLSPAIGRWRDECLGALALLVAFLDERIAQAELGEDIIVEKQAADDERDVLDQRVGLREFPPQSRVRRRDKAVLQGFARLDTSRDDPVLAAGRWYLKAVANGPRPDAIAYFWIALEALSRPPWGTREYKRTDRQGDVALVEQAIAATGFDLSLLGDLGIGRLAGLRAEVVHGGVEAPELLRPGFYALEAMTRLLLRGRLGLPVPEGWPLQPTRPNLAPPLEALADRLKSRRKIVWREP